MTDYRIEAATKEEWAERALRAEAKLADTADAIWVEFKDKFEGEKKYALRQIVKWLKGEADGNDT
jgi:hypothetical protein